MKFKTLLLLLSTLLLFSCNSEIDVPKKGAWRAVFDLGNQKELPFIFDFTSDSSLTIFNAEEEIKLTDITIKGDSINIKHPVFEGVFKGIFTKNTIAGNFVKPSLDRVVPFIMTFGDTLRFGKTKDALNNVDGIWETTFSPDTPDDSYIAKGIFKQANNRVTGTFRTTTGDYRFLEGVMEGDSLKLSTFDGAHAFLFEAKVTDSTLNGQFYSGNHWKEPFTAKRNEAFELPKADSLTFLKEGYDKIQFSFPDTSGNMVSLTDDRFKDKVVLVQIMGTWCPNCLDETAFYRDYMTKNPSEDLEIIGLAFEYAKTEEAAMNSVKQFVKGANVPYPVLLAQHGTSSKKKANEKLPMLNHVLSYPTTIFIDKKGTVRKIHTGFNGPATGKKYTEFVTEFEEFVEVLLGK